MNSSLDWADVPALLVEARQMAHRLLSCEHGARSLQTTGLVLTALRRQRLVDQDWAEVGWSDRDQFFRALYRAMSRALIDHARQRQSLREQTTRRMAPEDLDFADLTRVLDEEPVLVEALTLAIDELRRQNARWAELVEHRYYSGYTWEETARVMGVPDRTLRYWWKAARALLGDEILGYVNSRAS